MSTSPQQRRSSKSTIHPIRRIPVEERFDDPETKELNLSDLQTSPVAHSNDRRSPPQPQVPRLPIEAPSPPSPTAGSPTSEDVAPEVFRQVIERRLDEQVC